jgi:bifunctional enzyme CysN/CysC
MAFRERMNVVVVGHVDHGKSTVIGRLLADTGSLPQGKLEQVKALCQKNAKPFEYAFLLDALKDEQAQGITIDTARCFFKTEKRDYIIIDAPGHIEFLKNMVTGAARAEAALLVIDAKEGVQENSRRHGTLLSMLGIRQVVILVNKMDLVGYDPAVFESIRKEYTAFLGEVGIKPRGFVPISARDGVNLTYRADGYEGLTVLEYLDSFVKQSETDELPFRFAVQDVYKFTEEGDDRRILAGTVESGSVSVGDPVTFYPSGKHSTIKTIEAFNRPALRTVSSGQAVGFTLSEELYIRPGELMCRARETPACVSSRFRTHIFWLGKLPMISEKRYKLKLATARVPVYLAEVRRVLDASNLKAETGKKELDRHDVGECVLETVKPIAFDLSSYIEGTGRFVIVDKYEIAGGGTILEALPSDHGVLRDPTENNETTWERGTVSVADREKRNRHKSKLIVLTGDSEGLASSVGKEIEKRLFDLGFSAYFLGLSNMRRGLKNGSQEEPGLRDKIVRRLGDLARVLTDSGTLFIVAFPDADADDLGLLGDLNAPRPIFTVQVGPGASRDAAVDLSLPATDSSSAATQVIRALQKDETLPEFDL